jgi:hypothetical protein
LRSTMGKESLNGLLISTDVSVDLNCDKVIKEFGKFNFRLYLL